MNFLAHILLAPDTEARVGALLGDFVKMPSEARFGATIHREILLHRKIDSFTDSHAIVLASKSLFRRETRRFAGILLDVYYDHLLARDWTRYCDQPLQPFVQQFYREAGQFAAKFPPDFARAFSHMVAENWLESYREFAGVEITLRRIGWRRPHFAAPLLDGITDLRSHGLQISRSFPEFFADLARFAAASREAMMGVGVR